MKIKEVTVGIQRVINLGNYENVRYECSAKVELEDGEDPKEAYAHGIGFCKENVGAELERLKPAKPKA